MHLNWLALAVPLFLFFMGVEYLVAKWQKKNYFQFNNSVANLNVGIAERLLDSFTVGAFYFVYDYLHQHYALLDIRANAWRLDRVAHCDGFCLVLVPSAGARNQPILGCSHRASPER